MSIVIETKLPLPLLSKGKVRDSYDLGNEILFVTTDRISAFDFVLPDGIPDKGFVLNQLSAFWFDSTKQIVPNHMINLVDSVSTLNRLLPEMALPDSLIGRTMLVRKAVRIPVECVVRGYLSGSAWSEYEKTGAIFGIQQPRGLVESQELSFPLFTPTTKADTGHDAPLQMNELVDLVGKTTAKAIEEKSLAIYQFARSYASSRGIIIADTKFEFGFIDGKLALIDEVLTPDSSRFWDTDHYLVGKSQPSFDKQPVRDWLVASGWNKQPPVPSLPEEVIGQTSNRYKIAYNKIVGKDIST
jgi:phosphoribosylaminoimidazole-succinocarboxamide synthase